MGKRWRLCSQPFSITGVNASDSKEGKSGVRGRCGLQVQPLYSALAQTTGNEPQPMDLTLQQIHSLWAKQAANNGYSRKFKIDIAIYHLCVYINSVIALAMPLNRCTRCSPSGNASALMASVWRSACESLRSRNIPGRRVWRWFDFAGNAPYGRTEFRLVLCFQQRLASCTDMAGKFSANPRPLRTDPCGNSAPGKPHLIPSPTGVECLTGCTSLTTPSVHRHVRPSKPVAWTHKFGP